MSITDFFSGKVLLITGGTAFLGQPMVAKILTSLPNVQKIYLLIRSRIESNGKVTSAQERFEKELLTSDVFDALRQLHGVQFESWVSEKVTAVEGELTNERLGFSDADYERLQNEVDIFINIAGLVQFDPPFDASLKGNALAAKHVVTFAKGCSNAVFLHVSTAYVCGDKPGHVPEELHLPYEQFAQQHSEKTGNTIPSTLSEEIDYLLALNQSIRDEADTPEQTTHFQQIAEKQLKTDKRKSRKNPEALIEEVKADWLEERLVEAGLKYARSRGWNDTYTYMKFLAEHVVMELRGNLPTAIIRPSIIESSIAEPHPGWLGKYRMSEPLIVGFAKGRIPDFPADPDIILDIVPVDFVVNVMLAAAEAISKHGGIEVYHVATGTQNPLYFRGIVDATSGYFTENPMIENGKPISVPVWQFPSLEQFQKKVESKMRLLGYAIQALTLLPTRSAKRKRRRLFVKQSGIKALLHYIRIYAPYTRTNFEFATEKMQTLYDELSPIEKQRFNFDVSRISWKQYFQEIHIPGIKRHVLKLEDGTVDTPKQEEEADEYPAPAPSPIDKISPRTIVDLIEIQAKRIPDKIALQMVNDGEWERYTYAETYTCSRRAAYQLWNSSLRKGDRVVLVSENQPEWCIAYLAASQIGCTVVPLDAQTPTKEVLAIAEFTTAKAILISDAVLTKSGTQLSDTDIPLKNINKFNEIVNSNEEIPTDFPNVEITPDTVASIIFTMGTTVDAKGAMLTHGGFISNVQAVAKALPPTDSERILSSLPLYHALSFSCSLLMALYSGTTATFVNALRPTTLLKTMREDKTTAFIGVPRLFQMLQGTIERQASREETSGETLTEKAQAVMGGHIRVLVSGGAALSDAVYDGFQKFGMTLYQGYGMTETAPVLSVNPYLNSRRGSVGPAVEGVEFDVANPNSDGIGEIIAKGPSTMKGYYQNPDATEKAIRDGWLYTGDLGYIDEDGYLYITGHCKDIIVPASGKNIYPVELEALYQDSPVISEMCVVGIPYEDGSDTAIHTVIVPTDSEATTEIEIQNHLQKTAKQLPSYQQFHKTHLIQDALPKTENGSIDRIRVKEQLVEHLADEQAAMIDEVDHEQSGQKDALSTENIPEEILSPLAQLARMPAHKIHLDSHLDIDLGLDSLTRLDLLMLLESRLGQTIPDAMLANLQTVNDVVVLIETFAKSEPKELSESATKSLKLREKPHWYARAFRASIRSIYRRRFSFECFGLENIPEGKPYIITPNHTSHLDTLTVITALGQDSHRLWTLAARDYWFGNRLQGWFAHNCLNALPIERDGNFSQFLKDLRMANEVTEQNNGLLIFPEGTRSLDGKLQPFKQGILSLLIYGQQVPIIPAYIKGAFEVLPKGQNFPKKHPIRIAFGEPLLFEVSQKPEDITENSEMYQKFLTELENRVAKLGETFGKD